MDWIRKESALVLRSSREGGHRETTARTLGPALPVGRSSCGSTIQANPRLRYTTYAVQIAKEMWVLVSVR